MTALAFFMNKLLRPNRELLELRGELHPLHLGRVLLGDDGIELGGQGDYPVRIGGMFGELLVQHGLAFV